jgi:hypothetical protein
LRLNGYLVPVDHRNVAQGDPERRYALHSPGFLNGHYVPHGDLPTPGDDPTVDHDRLFEGRAESIALHIGIAG